MLCGECRACLSPGAGLATTRKVLDLSPEFRCLTSGTKPPAGKGLLGALAYFGVDSISATFKDTMQKRVMRGWPFSDEERKQILKYCASDIDALEPLLAKLLPHIDLGVALYRGESVVVAAVMEYRGVPIDMSPISTTARQEGVDVRARRHGAGDRRAIRRLCA